MTSRRMPYFLIAALVACGCAALRSASSPPTKIDEEVITVSSDDPTIVLQRGERIAIDGLDGESARLKMTRFKDDRDRIAVDFDTDAIEPGSAKVK